MPLSVLRFRDRLKSQTGHLLIEVIGGLLLLTGLVLVGVQLNLSPAAPAMLIEPSWHRCDYNWLEDPEKNQQLRHYHDELQQHSHGVSCLGA